MSKITAKQRVLDAMKGHGSISPWYAINHLGNTRLAATIFDLKKEGYNIQTDIVNGTNKFGDKIKYAKYSIKD